jgi:glycosyltransferase involved in cell wall biosynthesis
VAAENRGAAVIEPLPAPEAGSWTGRIADPEAKEVAAAPQRRLLFIQSACPDTAAKAVERLGVPGPGGFAWTYLTHDPSHLPPKALLPRGTEVLVAGRGSRFFRDLHRQAAAGRYDRVVALFTGEPGYRRFKLLALSLWRRSLLLVDRRGDLVEFGFRGLSRLVRRRLPTRPRPATEANLGEDRPQPPAATDPLEGIPVLRLPLVGRPAISVVLPVLDRPEAAYDSVRSIADGSSGAGFEVVLAGVGTPEATTAALSRIENARAARLSAGSGVAAAWNAGAALARGERLLFLAAGVQPAPGCLATLEEALDSSPDRGAVGARVLGPDGRLVEAGGIVWRDGTTQAAGSGEDPEAPGFSYLRETDYGSSAALLVRREAFERIGGFDTHLTTAAAAAADLCFGLRSIGLSVLTEPRATVLRPASGGAVPSGRDPARDQRADAARLRRKRRRALRRQLAPDRRLLFIAADRRRDKILLVIDHYVPTHDRDAGSYVMDQVLMTLNRLGYRIIFWPDNLYRLPHYTDRLQAAGIEVIYGQVSFEEFLAGCSRFLGGILIHRAPMASKYLRRIGREAPSLFYICADLEHLREQRRAALDGGSGAREVSRLLDRELAILGRVDRAAVHSPVERDYLARTLPGKAIGVLPLPVRPGGLEGLDFERRRGLLFVGSTHPPNVDAVDYYAGRLAPRIARALPGVELTVVGEASKAVAERWARSGAPANGAVHLAGFVPALEDYYRSARVYVAPLRYGAGVKGKILEAMSHGVPVVTTSVGAEGIPIVPGVDALVADDEEAFANAVAKLYRCRDTWTAIRANARRLIDEHYSERAFETALKALVDG